MNGDFFTVESFSTLAGASFGVFVVSNVVQHVFNFNPKWFAFILSFIFSFLGVFLSHKTGIHYLMAFLNGFLIYASTIGIVQVTGKKEVPMTNQDPPFGSSQNAIYKRTFRTKWF